MGRARNGSRRLQTAAATLFLAHVSHFPIFSFSHFLIFPSSGASTLSVSSVSSISFNSSRLIRPVRPVRPNSGPSLAHFLVILGARSTPRIVTRWIVREPVLRALAPTQLQHVMTHDLRVEPKPATDVLPVSL